MPKRRSRKPKLSEEQLRRAICDVHSYNVNLHTREIYLHGYHSDGVEDNGIEFKTASMFIKNLHLLESQGKTRIIIHMQVGGGDWIEGISMFDAVQAAQSPITIIAYGQASSMSGVFMQAATRRLMMPNAHFMLHYGSFSIDATSVAASQAVKLNDEDNRKMVNLFAGRCMYGEYYLERGWDEIKVSKDLARRLKDKHDWYLNAEEAVYYGFADGILGVDSRL